MNLIQKMTDKDMKLTENFTAYLLGALRDGYLDEKQYLISIGQKDEKWLEYLKSLIKKNFGIESNIRPLKNAFELRVFSKEFFMYLRGKGVVNSSTIPRFIMDEKSMWIPFISGFFDAEGYCTSAATFKKTGKKKISFHQNDRMSLEFIKSALESFGIKTGKIYLQQGRYCHALYIQSKDGIRNFNAIFKPIRKRKQIDDLLSVLPP